jgi:hypothetical protein
MPQWQWTHYKAFSIVIAVRHTTWLTRRHDLHVGYVSQSRSSMLTCQLDPPDVSADHSFLRQLMVSSATIRPHGVAGRDVEHHQLPRWQHMIFPIWKEQKRWTCSIFYLISKILYSRHVGRQGIPYEFSLPIYSYTPLCPIDSWLCYINTNVAILDIIHRPFFDLKLNSTP